MRSRIETGRALRGGQGPGDGISGGRDHRFGQHLFEMIRFMTELFPILPGPL